MLALLGTASDDVIAKRLGLTRELVWWKLKDRLVLPSHVLVRKHGLSSTVIAKLRREYRVNAPGRATN